MTHDSSDYGNDETRANDDDRNDKPRRRFHIPWPAVGIVSAVLMVIGLFCQFVAFPQSVISDGNKQETTLNTAAGQAFGSFHLCVVNTARAAQVVGAQTDAVDKILKDAVGGRYGTGAKLDQAKLYSALQEAYPDLSGINQAFRDAMSVMTGCQKDFLAKQTFMNTRANDFESWATGSWFVRSYGGDKYPNQILKVTIGSNIHRGQDALDIMQRQVLDTDTVNALETGVDNSAKDDPFKPQPTPSR